MTPDELDQAIAWFERKPPMPGARKMYGLALQALKAIRVDASYIDNVPREELIHMVHSLRAANIARGRLIDRLEDEVYRLKGGGKGGADHAVD